MTIGNGDCWNCPHFDRFSEYCDIYKMNFYGQGCEPTCNYSEETEVSNEQPV